MLTFTLGSLIKTKLSSILYVCIFALLGLILHGQTAVAANKITVSPSTVTITEGASQNVTISLSEPIICPDPLDCDLSLSFNSSDPQASATPYPLVYQTSEWAQNKTLTIHTTADGIFSADKHITLSATTESNSEFYKGYVVTIPVTITNIDPPPAPDITDHSLTVTNNGKSTGVDVLTGVANDPDPSSLEVLSGPSHGIASVNSPFITTHPTADLLVVTHWFTRFVQLKIQAFVVQQQYISP